MGPRENSLEVCEVGTSRTTAQWLFTFLLLLLLLLLLLRVLFWALPLIVWLGTLEYVASGSDFFVLATGGHVTFWPIDYFDGDVRSASAWLSLDVVTYIKALSTQ